MSGDEGRDYLASTDVVVPIIGIIPVGIETVVAVPVRVGNVAIRAAYCLTSSLSPEIFFKISCVLPAQAGFFLRLYLTKTRQAVSFINGKPLSIKDRFDSHGYCIKRNGAEQVGPKPKDTREKREG